MIEPNEEEKSEAFSQAGMSDRRRESQHAIRPKTWNEHQDIEVGKDSHGIDAAGNEEHEGEASTEDSMEGDAAE